MTRVFVPRDSAALSVGADEVAQRIIQLAQQRGAGVEVVRTGSRGMLWLEPLVEVETPEGRVGFGPVSVEQVDALVEGGLFEGQGQTLNLGLVEDLPWMRRQQRLCFARCGRVDPLSVEDYRAQGGFEGLRQAALMEPAAIVMAVEQSGLRGRGGAAFPTGIKWKTVLEASGETKYIVCNADEGDSGTFSDRMLMEGDPMCLIEGMAIAGFAVGARQGYIYLRSEYPEAYEVLSGAIAAARAAGWLGQNICDSARDFDIEIRLGAGAYICGEETSLLESIEGKRGQVRFKPPLPAIEGLFGRPTVVNNVITLASVPVILAQGPDHYRDFGCGRSRGTLPVQLAGNIRQGGLLEVAFGISLRELIEDLGGGTRSGRPLRAVQVGGPLGAYLPESSLDVALDYEALAGIGGMLGHGGVVVFDDRVDLAEQARYAMSFCAVESCGKCTPCRIGSTRGVEVIDRLRAGDASQEVLLRELCDTMRHGSLCALGGLTPDPVLSALDHFPEDFTVGAPARGVQAAG